MNLKAFFVLPFVAFLIVGWFAWDWLWPEPHAKWLGYVEGEVSYIAAPLSGALSTRPVERGDRVSIGDALFSLDPVSTDADTARLRAQVEAAQAQSDNLQKHRQRPAELEVSRAQQAGAAAEVVRTQQEFDRIAVLAGKGFATRSQRDTAKAALDVARASLARARAEEASGELSAGRSDEVVAAAADIEAAKAALRAQQKRRSEIAPTSPATGIIEQTFFNLGEWVPANTPVVAVLPDNKRKLRFFVPEQAVAQLRPGIVVQFSCDGCGSARQATVSYISPRAEFTPPVIYSERARAKLVFMVEASLPTSSRPLPIGLPVDVDPVMAE